MKMSTEKQPETIAWIGDIDGHLRLIDQTRLPTELHFIDIHDVETVGEAIKSLRVRGAPAIGIAAAYGVCVGLQHGSDDETSCYERLNEVVQSLAQSRPTAVNLFWALERMRNAAESLRGKASVVDVRRALLDEAKSIHAEDREKCRAIGRHGAQLLPDECGVLTHCNAGSLATSEYGTALSVFFTARDAGKQLHVFVDETRPLLQGARLTAWELLQQGIPATLICDSMAAQVMREGRVGAVVTGADRIAANGDTANKIGTYSVAVLAQAHKIPFYVAAPSSTFDLSIPDGQEIPIEQRSSREITHGFGQQTAPDGITTYNPAFDVTPVRLIDAIITEFGVIRPVTTDNILQMIGSAQIHERE